jgi:5-methylcytosine-specific restriction protein B
MKTLHELGTILLDMYKNAPPGKQVTMVYLFGVKYHDDIVSYGVKNVVEAAGMRLSYITELTKSVKLAKYVTPS